MFAKSKIIITSIITISLLSLGGCQTILEQTATAVNVTNVDVKNVDVKNVDNKVTQTNITSDIDSDNDGVIDTLDMCPATPDNIIIDERGYPAPAIPKDDEILMDYRAYFDFNSSMLKESYQKELDVLGKKLSEYDDVRIRISGMIANDEWVLENQGLNDVYQVSTPPIPSQLAKDRANVIKHYLMANYDIKAERIITYDCGNRTPIADGIGEDRAYNRRVYARMTNISIDDEEEFAKDISVFCKTF